MFDTASSSFNSNKYVLHKIVLLVSARCNLCEIRKIKNGYSMYKYLLLSRLQTSQPAIKALQYLFQAILPTLQRCNPGSIGFTTN